MTNAMRMYVPAPPLSDFVELIWLYEGYRQPHLKERVLPTGTVELVINLCDDVARVYDREKTDRFQTYPGSLVSGAHSRFFVIDTAEQASVLGVHFKPGGAFPFLGVPAGELQDTHVSLESLWGRRAGELRQRLLETRAPGDKFEILEEALLAQAWRPLERHPAIRFALEEFRTGRPVTDVVEQIGLSRRHFIELFRDEVGLTPKLFCRVQRFQQVLRLIDAGRRIEWANLAQACGYFDQAHFIHDFRAFSGINPTAYAAQRTEHMNHVPLDG